MSDYRYQEPVKYVTIHTDKKGALVGRIQAIDKNSLVGVYAEPRFELLKDTWIVNIYLEGPVYKNLYTGSHGSLISATRRFDEYMKYPEFTILKYA